MLGGSLLILIKAASKKSSFLSGRTTKKGGGLNGCATKEKRTFFNVRKKIPLATKPRPKTLVDGPLRKDLFLRLPLV